MKTIIKQIKPKRFTLELQVHQMIAKYADGFNCDVYIRESLVIPNRYLADIKITKLFSGRRYRYSLRTQVYTIEHHESNLREAIIRWSTMGSFTSEFCSAYVSIIAVATKMAEQLNEIYN